jgi:gliding motility-associated-like protein
LVDDLSGCSPDDSITLVVNVPAPVVVNADFTYTTTPSCFGLGVSTTNLSTGGAMSPEWDMGDGIVYQMPFVPMHYYPNPGTYTITLIVNDPLACNLSDTMAVVVQVDSVIPPDASFTIANVIGCTQTTTTTTNTSVGSYTEFDWDMGDGTLYNTTNVVHTYTVPGTYTIVLTATDTLGCYPPDTAMAQITIAPPPPINADFTVVQLNDCNNLSVQTTNLSTGNNMAFAWDMGDGTTYGNVPNVLHNYSATGQYSIQLVVTDLDACVPNDTIVVSIILVQPTQVISDFTVAQDPICTGLQVDCQNLSTGPAPVYLWDMGDGTTYTGTDVVDHVYAAPGSYTVTLIATDTSTCNDADTTSLVVTINPYAPVAAAFTPVEIFDCLQSILDLTNNSTGSFMSFLWDMGDGTQYTDTNVTHAFANAGTYDVSLVVSDLSGCSPNDTATVQVTIDPIIPVVADFTIDQVGNCTFLTVQGTNLSTGDSIAFTWDMGDGTTYTTTDVIHAYTAVGTYNVTLTVDDLGCGNDDTFTTTITVLDSVPVAATSTGVICPDSTLAIYANGAPGSTYIWNDGSTDPVLFVSQPGQYFVTVTYDNCVGSDTVDVIESVPQELSYSFEACPNTAIALTVPFQGSSYLWENGDTEQSIYLLYPGADTTTYSFMVWDNYGCLHDDTVTVIPLSSDARLFAPNAFTPDGDGINDEFVITGYGEREVELLIFNRWGEQIYSTTTLSDPWNGVYNGLIKQDVYVYKLTYNGECTNDETRVVGHVTVVK